MALETTITDGILKYLNSIKGCKAEKLMGNAFQKDKPDINGCLRGRMFKIEVKSPDNGNQATKGQVLELKKWAKAGATCFVAYSVADVKAMINDEERFHRDDFHGVLYTTKLACSDPNIIFVEGGY